MPTRPVLFFAFTLFALAACGGSDGGLTVQGEVVVQSEGAAHNFSFPNEISLAPASYEQPVFSGQCVYLGDRVSVSVVRPGDRQEGLSQFNLDAGESSAQGAILLDGRLYEGECSIELLYREDADGIFGVELSCDALVGDTNAAPATLRADLIFSGCVTP